ncbi:MAG TPA: DUF1028 domain-containing protein [Acidimicrobiales bacterium]|nr:DUF1028 domain-containing protein [Acidimicrobiales bacterium]
MTYSLVARDAATGQLGVAAQSCYFALGAVLPWARAGVGAVATQSMVDPGYGPRCLDLLAAGSSAAAALSQVRAADPGNEVRQVGLVAADGEVASFTGSLCIDHISHARGDGYSAQANMMAGPGVCEAMAAAFEASAGSLAHRLVAGLVAAEGQGGDARGVMSAALIVVEGTIQAHPWQGVLVDVRVDHHPDPLGELARLVSVAEAYHLCDQAEEALVRGDAAAALAGAEAGLALLPGEENLLLSYVGALIGVGRVDEAAAELRRLIARRPAWEGIVRALCGRGLVPLPDGLTVDALLAAP